jgi:hypothetical protein
LPQRQIVFFMLVIFPERKWNILAEGRSAKVADHKPRQFFLAPFSSAYRRAQAAAQ